MAIASKVQDYMSRNGVHYDVVAHPHSHNSSETAELARVPGDRLAKSVVLEHEDGFVIAVLPSTCHVKLARLGKEINHRMLRLATEDDVEKLFDDCERGAVPAVGPAYGLATYVDDALAGKPEIYFEAGDHEQLIRMTGNDFMSMMSRAGHARFASRY